MWQSYVVRDLTRAMVDHRARFVPPDPISRITGARIAARVAVALRLTPSERPASDSVASQVRPDNIQSSYNTER